MPLIKSRSSTVWAYGLLKQSEEVMYYRGRRQTHGDYVRKYNWLLKPARNTNVVSPWHCWVQDTLNGVVNAISGEPNQPTSRLRAIRSNFVGVQ